MHNTEDIALVVQSGITESVISINFVNGSVNKNLRPRHSCVIKVVSSGQPLWFCMVQVADVLLAPETILC